MASKAERDSTDLEEGRQDLQLPFFGQIMTSNRESFIAGVAEEVACQCVPITASVPAVCFVAL